DVDVVQVLDLRVLDALVAVGDGVAERDHRPHAPARARVNTGEEIPARRVTRPGPLGEGEGPIVAAVVARSGRGQVAGLPGGEVLGRRLDQAGDEDADREVLEWLDTQ